MSTVKNFLKELIALHPELHDFYDSEQYRLSEEIIENIVKKCMTEEQISELLKLDVNYFIRLTSGDNTIDVNEYKLIINQLKDI